MLYQAFLNILINAMQAMPEGGRIDIVVAAVNEHSVAILFKDESPVITQDVL